MSYGPNIKAPSQEAWDRDYVVQPCTATGDFVSWDSWLVRRPSDGRVFKATEATDTAFGCRVGLSLEDQGWSCEAHEYCGECSGFCQHALVVRVVTPRTYGLEN